jgi:hypothetical protein
MSSVEREARDRAGPTHRGAEAFAAGWAAGAEFVRGSECASLRAERDELESQRDGFARSAEQASHSAAEWEDLERVRDQAVEATHDAKEALSLVYVMLVGTEEPWASLDYDERCARAANEAQQAFLVLDRAAPKDKGGEL